MLPGDVVWGGFHRGSVVGGSVVTILKMILVLGDINESNI